MLEIRENRLIYHYDAEEVWIEPWGPNALRVRATKERQMPEEDWALCRKGEDTAEISYTEQGARIVNGRIRAEITKLGKIMIYNADGRCFWKSIAGTEGICWTRSAVRSRLRPGNSSLSRAGIII